PTRKLGKRRNVRLYQIFPRLHLIEVLLGSDRRRRVPDIARPRVPIVADLRNFYIGKRRIQAIFLAPRLPAFSIPVHAASSLSVVRTGPKPDASRGKSPSGRGLAAAFIQP